jgi:PAS domain S-box-containing protein/diguanylate cyclase (GGDEF)-like protein
VSLEGVLEGEKNTAKAGAERHQIQVLLIDDDEGSRRKLHKALAEEFDDITIEEIIDHVGFFRAIKGADFDLVITAQDLHWSSGTEILNAVKSLRPGIPVIMVADTEDEEVAATALEQGLDAYVAEAAERSTRLTPAVRSALQLIDYEDRVVSLEERLQVLLDRLNVGVFRCTPDGRLLEANPAFLRLIGAETLEKAQQAGFDSFFVDRLDLMEGLSESGQSRDATVPMLTPDGTTAWVALTQTLEITGEGERVIDGLAEDVTLAYQGEEALRKANDQHRTIFEVTRAATAIIDSDGTVSMINVAFADMLGYSREEIEGRMVWTEFIARDDVERIRKQHRQRLQSNDRTPRTSRFEFIDRDGKILQVAATEAILPGSQRTVVSLLNLTERRQAEEELLHRAFHDPKTGLPNRHALLERLQAAMEATGAGYALLALALDRFRVVSDGLGYRVAELLLIAVAKRLAQYVGENSFLACIEGGSFAVLLHPMESVDQAKGIADGLVDALASPFVVDKHRLHTSVSIGILMGEGEGDPEEILRDAEGAAHRSKQLGGRCSSVFEPELRERAARVQTLENDLRRAYREGEFLVYYQPIASLSEGTIIGFEALLRWSRMDSDLIEPGEFLDVAEESGLIVPIGVRVLEDACRQLRTWSENNEASPDFFVSVNLSSYQLVQPDLVATVDRVLRETEVDPKRLVFEVREREIIGSTVVGALSGLAKTGVRVCIEEFGGGVAFLGEGEADGVSMVKIDRSVLAVVGEDEGLWKSVEMIVALARDLELGVIAEGVETADQIKRLIELGCEWGQGNLFSEPVDMIAATELLEVDLMW